MSNVLYFYCLISISVVSIVKCVLPIYTTLLNPLPCVLRLTSNFTYGCVTNTVSGKLTYFNGSKSYGDNIVVMNSTDMSPENIDLVSTNGGKGLIVVFYPLPTSGFSDENKTEHNPYGRNLLEKLYDIPIIGIPSNEIHFNIPSSSSSLTVASGNYIESVNDVINKGMSAELKYGPMFAASSRLTDNPSETCLRRSSTVSTPFCRVLGDHSVFSTFSNKIGNIPKPIVWLTARLDGRSLFFNNNFKTPSMTAGNSYSPGLVLLLGIANALSNLGSKSLSTLNSDIVFSFFNTEAFDLSGSKRFIKDLTNFECLTPGDNNQSCSKPFHSSTDFTRLKIDRIISLVEFGQIGGKLNLI